MRATVLFGAGDVRIENVPDARLIEPTDAVVIIFLWHDEKSGSVWSEKTRISGSIL